MTPDIKREVNFTLVAPSEVLTNIFSLIKPLRFLQHPEKDGKGL